MHAIYAPVMCSLRAWCRNTRMQLPEHTSWAIRPPGVAHASMTKLPKPVYPRQVLVEARPKEWPDIGTFRKLYKTFAN